MFGWTTFGKVKFGDEVYSEDIIVHTDLSVSPRDKSIAKSKYGDSHIVGREELEKILDDDTEAIVIGSGQFGVLKLNEEAVNFLRSKNIDFYVMETPEAIKKYNHIFKEKKTMALIHVTC
ncbi:hypothetical protein DRN74_02365 [Candidatus Micrarchaeota archaeon]|nr:MAG: hypothetical protein DRN74_02365 [Candidatus Micrarchaeota archaeon]